VEGSYHAKHQLDFFRRFDRPLTCDRYRDIGSTAPGSVPWGKKAHWIVGMQHFFVNKVGTWAWMGISVKINTYRNLFYGLRENNTNS